MFRRDSKPSDEDKNKKRRELKVLFVSKRDTCRGPMAEAILNYLADKYSMKTWNRFTYRVNSAGFIKYNQGYLPEQLALRVLAENHLETLHGSRQVSFSLINLELDFAFDRRKTKTKTFLLPHSCVSLTSPATTTSSALSRNSESKIKSKNE